MKLKLVFIIATFFISVSAHARALNFYFDFLGGAYEGRMGSVDDYMKLPGITVNQNSKALGVAPDHSASFSFRAGIKILDHLTIGGYLMNLSESANWAQNFNLTIKDWVFVNQNFDAKYSLKAEFLTLGWEFLSAASPLQIELYGGVGRMSENKLNLNYTWNQSLTENNTGNLNYNGTAAALPFLAGLDAIWMFNSYLGLGLNANYINIRTKDFTYDVNSSKITGSNIFSGLQTGTGKQLSKDGRNISSNVEAYLFGLLIRIEI